MCNRNKRSDRKMPPISRLATAVSYPSRRDAHVSTVMSAHGHPPLSHCEHKCFETSRMFSICNKCSVPFSTQVFPVIALNMVRITTNFLEAPSFPFPALSSVPKYFTMTICGHWSTKMVEYIFYSTKIKIGKMRDWESLRSLIAEACPSQ